MAETIKKSINYEIAATLRSMGFKKASDEIQTTAIETKKLEGVLGDVESVVKKLDRILGKLTGRFSTIGKSMLLSGTTGLKMFDVLENLNTGYLKLSSAARVYGVQLTSIRKSAIEAVDTMRLTRQEAVELFKVFSGTLFETTIENFEKIGTILSSVVGPNLSEMSKLLGNINQAVLRFPDMQQYFLDVSDPVIVDNINKLAIASASAGPQFYNMALAMAEYATAGHQATEKSEEARKQMQAQQETFQKLREVATTIAAGLAEVFYPVLQRIADWFSKQKEPANAFFELLKRKIQEVLGGFFKLVKTIVVVMIALKGLLIAIPIFKAIGMALVALMGPLGWVITAISALIGGAIAIELGKTAAGEMGLAIANIGSQLKRATTDISEGTEGRGVRKELSPVGKLIKLATEEAIRREAVTEQLNLEIDAYDSLIKRQQYSGQLSEDDLQIRQKGIIKAMQKTINLHLKNIEYQKLIIDNEKATADERMRAIAELSRSEKAIFELRSKQTEVMMKQAEMYNIIVSIASKEANISKQLVSLADNFAIGVGASAEMRTRAVEAIGKEIETMRLQVQIYQRNIELGQDIAINKEKLLGLEVEILGKQIEQASMLKVLRDGWVSAIGAMNTGAGRYAKILMTTTKNTASLIKLGGQISSYSGSYRGGYTTAARYNPFAVGGIDVAKGGVGGGLAYHTMGTRAGAGALESIIRGDIGGATRGLQSMTRAMGSNVRGLGFYGSPYYRGPALAQGTSGGVGRIRLDYNQGVRDGQEYVRGVRTSIISEDANPLPKIFGR